MVTAVVLAPGLLMGAALPAASGAISDHRRTARGVGTLYAWATVGNILGALGAGYLLVRAVKQEAYIGFIYAVLLVTSCTLIIKSFG